MHPILAIDHGEARIGIAATDEFALGVHPVETIDCRKSDPIPRIVEITQERGIQKIILGLPLRLDGSEGNSAEKIRRFGSALTTALPNIPLEYLDERFTTVTAAEKLHAAGKNAKAQKSLIDQAAAVEILNSYLGW